MREQLSHVGLDALVAAILVRSRVHSELSDPVHVPCGDSGIGRLGPHLRRPIRLSPVLGCETCLILSKTGSAQKAKRPRGQTPKFVLPTLFNFAIVRDMSTFFRDIFVSRRKNPPNCSWLVFPFNSFFFSGRVGSSGSLLSASFFLPSDFRLLLSFSFFFNFSSFFSLRPSFSPSVSPCTRAWPRCSAAASPRSGGPQRKIEEEKERRERKEKRKKKENKKKRERENKRK